MKSNGLAVTIVPGGFITNVSTIQTYRRNGNANSVSNIILSLSLLLLILCFVLPSLYTKKVIAFTSG